ncbi:DNA dC-_dU-editing enzyme APOBEC-3H-like isoform X2 [Pogona vitticeps]
MPFFLKTLLPEKDFEENFNNTFQPHKTLVLFSLKKDKSSLWKTWGYAYNNPNNEHAEHLILDNIEIYIQENQIKGRHTLTLFMSYTPCRKCSARIKSFLTSRNDLCMDIKASRPYFFEYKSEQKGLYLLKSLGVSIKMMDQFDYEQCLHEFVHPSKKLTPWLGLEEQSKKNADDLENIWKQFLSQEEEKETEENAKIIKISNHDNMIGPQNISVCTEQLGAQDVSRPHIILDGQDHHDQSPTKDDTWLSTPETPQKRKSTDRATEPVPGAKRKLDFLEK